METWVSSYASTVVAMGAMAGLSALQLVLVDLVGIGSGHTPGTPVTPDHGNLFFRVTRAHANTNESIAVFILAALFGILSGTTPSFLGGVAWIYVAARAGHMLCYYADLRIPRSIFFGFAVMALLAMLVAGFSAWV